jgi:hypothetical protein
MYRSATARAEARGTAVPIQVEQCNSPGLAERSIDSSHKLAVLNPSTIEFFICFWMM